MDYTIILLMMEFIMVLILIKSCTIRDAMGRIESILEDINDKLGEKEED